MPIPNNLKIEKISVPNQVFDRLKENIIRGIWEPGDKIPSEEELAKTYGVNRLSIRMAINKLNTLDIVETRVGAGTFVKNHSLKPIFKEIAFLYEDEKSLKEVQQLRNLMERECTLLSIYRSSENEKKEVLEALEEYDKIARAYFDDNTNEVLLKRYVEADFNFHYQMVKMSHNTIYKDIYYMIENVVSKQIASILRIRVQKRKKAGLGYLSPKDDSHHKIYEALISRDEKKMAEACDEMYGLIPIKGLDYFESK